MPDALETRLAAIEARLAKLEKNSHAPVDLTPFIRAEIIKILREAADNADLSC